MLEFGVRVHASDYGDKRPPPRSDPLGPKPLGPDMPAHYGQGASAQYHRRAEHGSAKVVVASNKGGSSWCTRQPEERGYEKAHSEV